MTTEQLQKACSQHKYLALRYSNGDVIGLNTKCAEIAKSKAKPRAYTIIVSYRPISFIEYIGIKTPFK